MKFSTRTVTIRGEGRVRLEALAHGRWFAHPVNDAVRDEWEPEMDGLRIAYGTHGVGIHHISDGFTENDARRILRLLHDRLPRVDGSRVIDAAVVFDQTFDRDLNHIISAIVGEALE